RQPITPEDLYLFRWIDHVRIDPAGERVAYQQSWGDGNERRNRGQVCWCSLAPGAEPVAATNGRLDHSPEWSPHGRRLAYVCRHRHACGVEAEGGEPRQVTSGRWGVADFDRSPDGGSLVVAGNAEPDADLTRDLNLYVVTAAGRPLRKLTGGFLFEHPRWSPH